MGLRGPSAFPSLGGEAECATPPVAAAITLATVLTGRLLTNDSAAEFEGVTFAFVCVDRGSARDEIFDLLIQLGIPFIDVGMGLKRKDGPINGMMRVTFFQTENAAELTCPPEVNLNMGCHAAKNVDFIIDRQIKAVA